LLAGASIYLSLLCLLPSPNSKYARASTTRRDMTRTQGEREEKVSQGQALATQPIMQWERPASRPMRFPRSQARRHQGAHKPSSSPRTPQRVAPDVQARDILVSTGEGEPSRCVNDAFTRQRRVHIPPPQRTKASCLLDLLNHQTLQPHGLETCPWTHARVAPRLLVPTVCLCVPRYLPKSHEKGREEGTLRANNPKRPLKVPLSQKKNQLNSTTLSPLKNPQPQTRPDKRPE